MQVHQRRPLLLTNQRFTVPLFGLIDHKQKLIPGTILVASSTVLDLESKPNFLF